MRGLKGKLALITGGAGGIGLAICKRMAAEGCALGILDIDGDAAKKTCDIIKAEGGTASPLQADICNYPAAQAAVKAFVTAQGRPIDILINNVGVDVFCNFLQQSPDLFPKLVGINLVGPMNMTHIVAPGMVERGAGRIINIASDAGRNGSSGETVYAAAKGGVIAFSKSMARELAGKKVTVNCVCPGPTETTMMHEMMNSASNPEKFRDAMLRAIPMRRFGQPDDVAGIVTFMASDETAYITGQTISVSGGLSMAG